MILIYGLAEHLNPIKSKLSDTIHSCMVDVLGLPEDKRAQRFFPMAREDFYAPEGRSEAYTVIEINLIEGRSVDTKKKLILSIFRRLTKNHQMAPVDVEITLQEQPAHCWGFRGITGDVAKLNYKIEV